MASLLRLASRRVRALPPAFEKGMLPGKGAPKPLEKMASGQHAISFVQREVMTRKGFYPRFNTLQSIVPHYGCAKVGVDPGLLRRGFFSSSRPSAQPPEKIKVGGQLRHQVDGMPSMLPNFTFYIIGGKMSTKQDQNRGTCTAVIRGNEDVCRLGFWFFVRDLRKGKWKAPMLMSNQNKWSAAELDYARKFLKFQGTPLYARLQMFEGFIEHHYGLYSCFVGMLLLAAIGEVCDWQIPGGRRTQPVPPSD